MKNKLVEITRDKTNFFTSIFVYDNKNEVPMENVEVSDDYNRDNKYRFKNEERYVVFFKDLETGEKLKFFVDRDAELINDNKLKTDNKFLIERMQEFVRLNCYSFMEYYQNKNKNKTINELIESIKINHTFTVSRKIVELRYKLTDEQYWENQMILSSSNGYTNIEKVKDVREYFYPKKEMVRELLCKCIMWNGCKEQFEKWVNYITSILFKVMNKVRIWFDRKPKKVFYSFFNKYIDSWDIECAFASTQTAMTIYFPIDYKKFGAPNIVNYNKALRIYKQFQREFYSYVEQSIKTKNTITDCLKNIKEMVDKYLKLASQKCIVGKQGKYVNYVKENREVRVIDVGEEVYLNYAFFFVLPNEEIEERMIQLKYETVDNSIFISAEEFCNEYYNSLKDAESQIAFMNKLTQCDELIIKYAQFFEGKQNVINFLKGILEIRESNKKATAIFSDRELLFF